MYTSSSPSLSLPSSTEINRFSRPQSDPVPWHDPSPFGYLLETPSFTPTATSIPIYQYHDQPAEFYAPSSQFTDLYQESLASPASFDHPFYNASATHSTFPPVHMDFQPSPSITESSSFYQFMPSSSSSSTTTTTTTTTTAAAAAASISIPSSQPLFSSNANMSITPETTSLSVSYTPFINNTASFVPIQHFPQNENDQLQMPIVSNKKKPISSASKPTNKNNNNHESYKSSSSSSTSKTYPCDQCDKIFHRAYNLKSHQLSHSKARPYECRFDACPWRFSRPHDLRRHEQLHAGHRPFGCSTCGKRFAQLDALQRHARGDTICLRIATMLAHAASVTETTSTTKD